MTDKAFEELERVVKLAPKAFDPPEVFDPTMFDIQLGAWFDQMAGTSTGGLLAIYCACGAARGGGGEEGRGPRSV